jgi:hypothetical protein
MTNASSPRGGSTTTTTTVVVLFLLVNASAALRSSAPDLHHGKSCRWSSCGFMLISLSCSSPSDADHQPFQVLPLMCRVYPTDCCPITGTLAAIEEAQHQYAPRAQCGSKPIRRFDTITATLG